MDNRQTGYGRKAKKSAVIVSAIILLLSVSLFFGVYLAPRQTKEVYAQTNLSAPSEVESITVALNQDATNEHGVTGIYTSMSLQDLIDCGYFLITAHYADKTEVIDSGYIDFNIAYAKGGDAFSNLAFGQNEITFALTEKPEVETSFSVTAQQVSETSVKAEYDMDGEGNFLQDGKPQYIYDVDGLNKVSTYIKVYRMNNDGTKASETPLEYNTGSGYTLSARLSGGKLVAGKNTVNVNYEGRETSFVLNVVARDIVSLSVEVKEGVTLHNYANLGTIRSALEVTATYNNGNVEPFTGYTFASEDCTYKDYDLYAGTEANTTNKIWRAVCVQNKAEQLIKSQPFQISLTITDPTSISVEDEMGEIGVSQYTSGSEFNLAMLSENSVSVSVMFGTQKKGWFGSYVDGRFSVIYCTEEGTETEDKAFNNSHTGIKIKYTENGVSKTSSFIKIGEVVPKTIQEPAFESKSFTYDGEEHFFDVTNFDSEAVKLLVSVGEEKYTVRVEDGKAVIYSDNAAIQDAPFTASFADKTMTLGVKNVGTYAIQAALTDTDNFIWAGGGSSPYNIGNIQVAPGTYDFSVSFSENRFNYGAEYVFDAYDGSSFLKVDLSKAPQEIQQAFEKKTLNFRYTYYSSDNLTSPLEGAPVAVGTYFVSVTIEEHINYNETTSELTQGQFYIVKIGNVLENAEISFTASGDKNYTYGDTLVSPSFMADGNFSPYIKTNLAGISGFNGGLSGDYSVNYKGTANDGTQVDFTVTYTFAAGKWTASTTAEDGAYYPKLAGNYTLTLTVAATDDYENTSKTLEFTVNRKQLSAVITEGDNDFTYNGEEQTYNPVIAAGDQVLVTVSDNTGKDADSYSASVSLNDPHNYTWAAGQTASGQDPLEFSFTIARRQLSDPTLQAGEGAFDEGNTFVYSGDHFYVKVVDSPEIVKDETAYNVKGAGEGAKQINVGTFEVTFTLTDNYEWKNGGTNVKTLTWGITPKPIARPTSADAELTYNGETQYVTVNGETQQNAVQYAFGGDYSATNAGNYTVTLTPTANYKWSDGEERDEISVSWVIHKQDIDKSAAKAVLTNKNTKYDGTEQTWDLSALADQLTVSADNGASVGEQKVSAKDAKTYTVTVSINDKKNYKWSGEEDAAEAEDLTATWKIAPAALTVTWTGDSFTYNAEAQSPEYEVTGWKGDSGDYTLTLSIEGEKATKGNAVNAGDYTAKLTLSTSGNRNYYFGTGSEDTVEVTHAFTIKQAKLIVTWTDGINTVVYNGEEQTPAFTVSGWWGTDENEYGDKVTAVNPYTHAGSYSDLEFTITGTENYTLDYTAATSYTIAKKELTFSWSATKFVYNATAQSPVLTLSGFVGSEESLYNVGYVLSAKEGGALTGSQAINAGSYSVTATLSRTDGIMDYYISSTDNVVVTADFVIDKYTIDLYGDNGIFTERRYEATGDAIDVVFTVAEINGTAIGEIFTVTYADTKPSAAQDNYYTVTLKLTDAVKGNYCWDEENLYNESMSIYKGKDTLLEDGISVAAVYWITALQYQLEISFEGNTANKWTYGDTAPKIIVTATGENAPESLAGFEITYQYFKGTSTGDGSSLGDQMPTNAGTYTLRVTIKGNGTYASVENTIVFTIEQKEVTANLTVAGGTYGKWEKAVAENVLGSIDGDEVSAADFVFTYYVKNAEGGFDIIEEIPFHAGAYKVVMTLSAGKSNYFFTEKSQEFTIEKAEITVKLQGFADIYYGDVNPASGYTLVDNAKITEGWLLSEETLASIGLDGAFATTYTQGNGITKTGVKYEVYLSAYHKNTAALADYVVTIVRGELKVLPKTISLTVTDSNGTGFLGGMYNGRSYGINVAANDLYEGNDALIKVTYGGHLMNGTAYSSEEKPVNAGEYTYAATIGNENYILDKEYSGGFTIEKCQADVSWTEKDFTYNGKDQRAAVTASYQGGALSVNAPVGGFKDYSADAYTFTATFITDIENNNYYFSAAEEVEATTRKDYFMQRAAADITVKDGSVVYGDPFDNFGYTANLQNSETLEDISFFNTYKYATDYAVGNAVGGYNIYFAKDGSPLADGGSFDFGNYTFTLHYGALTVTQREITVSFTVPDGAVFSGNANELTDVTFKNLYNNVSPEAVIVYAAAGGNEVVDGKAVHQGKYSYALTIANGNYLLTGLTAPVTGASFDGGEVSGAFTVTKKTVSADWRAEESYIYTAQNQKESVKAEYTAVTGKKIKLAVTFEHNDTKSSEFIAAGEYTLTASFEEGDNAFGDYVLDGSKTHSLSIGKFVIKSVQWYYNDAEIAQSDNEYTYTGENFVPSFKVKFTGPDTEHELTFTVAGDEIVNVGAYTLKPLIGDYADNYAFGSSSFDCSAEILAANLSVTIAPSDWNFTYDGTEHSVFENFSATATGVDDKTAAWTYSFEEVGEYAAELKVKGAKVYTVYYKAELANHNAVQGSFTLTVNKKELVLKADAKTQYGTALGSNYKYEGSPADGEIVISVAGGGFVTGEGFNKLTIGSIVYESTYKALEADTVEKSYTITLTGGFTSDNYDISYSAGTVTVLPREVKVTIDKSTGHTYGDSAKNLADAGVIEEIASVENAVFNHAVTDIVKAFGVWNGGGYLTLVSDGKDLNDVGKYEIKLAEDGLKNANYHVTVAGGAEKYVIGARPIGIKFSALVAKYNGEQQGLTVTIQDAEIVAADSLTFTVTYTANGKTFVTTSSDGGKTWSGTLPVDAAVYDVEVRVTNTENYLASGGEAEFTIQPRNVGIVIQSQSSDYTGEVPAAGSAYDTNWKYSPGSEEFIEGDESQVSLYIKDASAEADEYVLAGRFGDGDGEFVESNYTVSFTESTYTVKPISLTITADNKNITYGGDAPAYTLTYDGLVARDKTDGKPNENVQFIGGTPAATSDYAPGAEKGGAGSYDIKFVSDEITANNYVIKWVTGKLTVEKRSVTITIKNNSSTYGELERAPEIDVTAWKDSQNWTVSEGSIYSSDDLGIILTISDGEAKYGVKKYDIRAKATSDVAIDNYDITFVGEDGGDYGVFTVNKKELTVTPNAFEVPYGTTAEELNGKFGYTLSDFAYEEDEKEIGLNGKTEYTAEGYTVKSPAGSKFTISATGTLAAPNYSFKYSKTEQGLTVIKRNITVAIEDSAFTFGGHGDADIYGMYDNDSSTTATVGSVTGLQNGETAGDGEGDVIFTYVYTGTANNGTQYDGTVKDGWTNGKEYKLDAYGNIVPLYAGTYTVTVSIKDAESSNYLLTGNESKTFRILKARIDALEWSPDTVSGGDLKPVTLDYSTAQATYTDKSYENLIEYIEGSAGGAGAFSLNHDSVRKSITMSASGGTYGEYYVEVRLTDSDNFVWIADVSVDEEDNPQVKVTWHIVREIGNTVEIKSGTSSDGEGYTFSVTQKDGKFWFDTENAGYVWYYGMKGIDAFTVGAVGDGHISGAETVYYVYYYGGGERFGKQAPTDAGTYYVVAVIDGTNLYDGAESAPVYFTIERALVEKPEADESEFVYTGTALTYDVAESEFYTVDGNVQTDAGSYSVTVALKDTRNYVWAQGGVSTGETKALTFSFDIAKKSLAKPVISEKYVYDHGAQVSLTLNGEGGIGYDYATMRIDSVAGVSNIGSISIVDGIYYAVAQNADVYKLVLSLRDAKNYAWSGEEGAVVEIVWTISPYEVKKLVSGEETALTYNGEERNYKEYFKAFADGETAYYALKGTLSATDASDAYSFSAVLNDKANYIWQGGDASDIVFVWKIAKMEDNSVFDPIITDWVYGQRASEPHGSSALFGAVEYVFYTEDYERCDEIAIAGAGNYFVRAEVQGTDNYNACVSEYVGFTIRKASFDVDSVSVADKTAVFDGTEHEISVSGLPDGLKVSLTYDGDRVNAGRANVTIEFLFDELASQYEQYKANYELPENMSAVLEILPKEVSVEWLEKEFVYDGTDQTEECTVEFAWYTAVDGSKVSLAYTVFNGSIFKNAGTYLFRAEQPEDANYKLAAYGNEKSYTMQTRKITVTADEGQKSVYGDNIASLTAKVTSGSIVEGDTGVYDLFVNADNMSNAGEYEIGIKVHNNNYYVDYRSARYTIEKREVTVQWKVDVDSLDYSGNDYSAMIHAWYVDIHGEKVELATGSDAMIAAGAYKRTADFTTDEERLNYRLSGAEVTYIVAAKTLDVEIGNNSHIYGSVQSATAVSSGIVPADKDATRLLLKYTGTAYNGTVYDGTVKSGWTEGVEYMLNEYGNVIPLYAGVYKIEVYAMRDDGEGGYKLDTNYKVTSGYDKNFTVAKADVSVPDEEDGAVLSKTYTGDTLTAFIPESDLYEVVQNEGRIGVGTADVVLALTDAFNYRWANYGVEQVKLRFTVTRAENAVTEVEFEGACIYGDKLDPKASAQFGEVRFVYSDSENGNYTSAIPVNAGTYWVKAVADGSENYSAAESLPKSFTIEKKSVKVPVVSGNAVYDGEMQSAVIEGFDQSIMMVGGISSGLQFKLEDGKLIVSATEKGTYTVTILLQNTDNYKWEDGTEKTVSVAWDIEEPALRNMVWLIAVLSVVLALEIIAAIVRGTRSRRNGDDPDGGDDGTAPDGGDDAQGGGQMVENVDGAESAAGESEEITETVEDSAQEPNESSETAENAEDTESDTEEPDTENSQNEIAEGAQAPSAEKPDEQSEEGAEKTNGGQVKLMSFAPLLLAAAIPAGQLYAIIALGAAVAVMGIVDIVLFVKTRKKKPVTEQTAEVLPVAEEESEPVTEEADTVVQEVEQPVEEAVLPAEEIPAPAEEETAASAVAEEEEDEEEDDEEENFGEEDDDEEEVEVAQPEEERQGLAFVPIPFGGEKEGKKIYIRYKFSFLAKLIQSPQEIQSRYGSFMDEVRAYPKMKSSASWKQVRIYSGRNTLAVILFKGRKLCVAFALDPVSMADTKYRGVDLSEVKRFAKTPYLLKITSPRRAKYAKELLAMVAENYNLAKGEVTATDFSLPYETTQELIEKGLVKVLTSGKAEDGDKVVKADISSLIKDKITLSEASGMITDEEAAEFIEVKKTETVAVTNARNVGRGQRAIVNIDTLSQNFEKDDLITLEILKEKKLVPSRAGTLKILARGMLDKPLTVEADDYSIDAVKMILLTGGKPIKIDKK